MDVVEFDANTITNELMKEFPENALKERAGGGGRMFTYIEGHAAIHRLLDVTKGVYDMEYVTHWIWEEDVPAKNASDKPKKRSILNVLIYVDIPGLGRKLGHGVAVLGGGEDLAKGALTDAYKNALKYAGMGLSLYGEDYEAPPAPVVVPPRKRLSQLLKTQGVKSQTDLDTAAQKKYNKSAVNLTTEEVEAWVAELEGETPF